jgi:hypothetical protein
MASSPATKHTSAAVLVAATGGLYGAWIVCWLFARSGAVPHQAISVLVWLMTIIMVGAPILLSGLAIWCAAAMLRNPATRTARTAAALVVGVAGILGFGLMFLFALAGATLL